MNFNKSSQLTLREQVAVWCICMYRVHHWVNDFISDCYNTSEYPGNDMATKRYLPPEKCKQ